jgi:hypothetical protein
MRRTSNLWKKSLFFHLYHFILIVSRAMKYRNHAGVTNIHDKKGQAIMPGLKSFHIIPLTSLFQTGTFINSGKGGEAFFEKIYFVVLLRDHQ